MIIPDVNLLVYTYDAESPYHSAAKRWWEGLVNGTEEVRIPCNPHHTAIPAPYRPLTSTAYK